MSAPGVATEPDGEARDTLENSLGEIKSVATVLMRLGAGGRDEECTAFAYLGGQLMDHYDDAYDAFCRIYKLDGYVDKKGGPT